MPSSSRHSQRITRSSGHSQPSGSEYLESEGSAGAQPDNVHQPLEPEPSYTKTKRGRTVRKATYAEADTSDDDYIGRSKIKVEENEEDNAADHLFNEDVQATNASSRPSAVDDGEDDDEEQPPRRTTRRRRTEAEALGDFIVYDGDDLGAGGRFTRQRRKQVERKRISRNNTQGRYEDDNYVEQSSTGSADGEGSLEDAPQTSSDLEMGPEPEPEPEPEDDGKPYSLRQRQRINYAIPPPLEEIPKPPQRQPTGRSNKVSWHGGHKKRGLGWSASGAELSRWLRIPGDDSDSDYGTRTPRKPFGGANLAPLGSGMAAGGFMPGDLAAAGTPSNLGKIGEAALADTDPLGVNMNVTFDEVGGLDEYIHSLKEMTLLPLLYPEVFQRFNITPPRGVLFHGPPGTGKTLMARALAASSRSNGKQISFFMRKGADCLSKWVGEAERQLRLLFEEAKASQPSIIFFDEIDGLAPVRSSKQDQIHASIVSTLLALMDGMDGRGQVVVIGATNRPDAVDPALRRPGRFDREFYFGLPTLEARERILSIMTRKWVCWGEDDGEEVKQRIRGLAMMTKGYAGADLRALCTEAALNAVQRRYPQIYKSTDRLQLKPETINVGLRDFMISIKKIVPSSARSSSSVASPLPSQFMPLLGDALEQVKSTIARVMPMEKPLSALEEAEFEDVGGEEGALEREMLTQTMQTLRVHRPRAVIHGPFGMGQNYVGAAALHYLEGYHVQSLELGTLMGDSTRTVEAAIVQFFVEAKRHQPSVIYIPSLVGWCAAVAEASRSTVRAMLDTLAPTDPILLLAVVDGDFASLPRDVKSWFGPAKGNRIMLTAPSSEKRMAFFDNLLKDICRPPNMYVDGMERKKRVLEVLPIAPPLEPRQPTAAELAVQEANDQRTIALLKYRLGPILTDLKRKFKKFTKRASEEYSIYFHEMPNGIEEAANPNVQPQSDLNPNGIIRIVDEAGVCETAVNGQVNGNTGEVMQQEPPQQEQEQEQEQRQQQELLQQQAVFLEQPKLYDMDLERMHEELYRGRYLTPQDFLNDVGKILRNARACAHEDLDRLHKAQAMYTFAEVNILEFDPALRMECERMAGRERRRREEHRNHKGKLKEKSLGDKAQQQNGTYIRRSARANGLEPELRITDPVKLERRLKRQRSECGDVVMDSNESEEGEGDGREPKRAKHVSGQDDEDDRDPLDCIGPSPNQSPRQTQPPHRLHPPQHVRFAAIEALSIPGDKSASRTPQPVEHGAVNGVYVEREEVALVNMSPRKQGGFDPFLLNPVSPSEDSRKMMVNGMPSKPIHDVDPSNPFFTPPPQEVPQHPTMMNVEGQTQCQPLNMDVDASSSNEQVQRKEQEPMVIERTPTPLPDFHIDEGLLGELRRCLAEDTAMLTVEQLEQLRATCLGDVWRHRKEWNRDALVGELLGVVKEFVEEVAEVWGCEEDD